jgi:hypothetical protein
MKTRIIPPAVVFWDVISDGQSQCVSTNGTCTDYDVMFFLVAPQIQ